MEKNTAFNTVQQNAVDNNTDRQQITLPELFEKISSCLMEDGKTNGKHSLLSTDAKGRVISCCTFNGILSSLIRNKPGSGDSITSFARVFAD